jgi:ribosomal-protein-alanine N-acetyltransferase
MADFWLKHQGTISISTERLILRKFSTSDASDMYTNWASDKDVAKYTLWRANESVNETRSFLEDWQLRYENKQYYRWAIVLKENMQVIGSISISGINNYLKCCDIGYTLSKKYWNIGIATEAAKCVIDFLVNSVGMHKIYAYHDIENYASGRVMQKCGMKYIKRKKKVFLNVNKTVIDCDYYCYSIK